MKPILILFIALALSAGLLVANEESAQDPFSPVPKTKEEQQQEELPFDVLEIKVILEKDGKVIGSYTAYVSENGDGEVFCTGAIKLPDGQYWKLDVQADLKPIRYSAVSLDVSDLNLFRKNGDGEIEPIEIFDARMQSKGFGAYVLGELQGITLKVNLSKAAP